MFRVRKGFRAWSSGKAMRFVRPCSGRASASSGEVKIHPAEALEGPALPGFQGRLTGVHDQVARQLGSGSSSFGKSTKTLNPKP